MGSIEGDSLAVGCHLRAIHFVVDRLRDGGVGGRCDFYGGHYLVACVHAFNLVAVAVVGTRGGRVDDLAVDSKIHLLGGCKTGVVVGHIEGVGNVVVAVDFAVDVRTGEVDLQVELTRVEIVVEFHIYILGGVAALPVERRHVDFAPLVRAERSGILGLRVYVAVFGVARHRHYGRYLRGSRRSGGSLVAVGLGVGVGEIYLQGGVGEVATAFHHCRVVVLVAKGEQCGSAAVACHRPAAFCRVDVRYCDSRGGHFGLLDDSVVDVCLERGFVLVVVETAHVVVGCPEILVGVVLEEGDGFLGVDKLSFRGLGAGTAAGDIHHVEIIVVVGAVGEVALVGAKYARCRSMRGAEGVGVGVAEFHELHRHGVGAYHGVVVDGHTVGGRLLGAAKGVGDGDDIFIQSGSEARGVALAHTCVGECGDIGQRRCRSLVELAYFDIPARDISALHHAGIYRFAVDDAVAAYLVGFHKGVVASGLLRLVEVPVALYPVAL